MKKTILFICSFVLSVLLFSACSKSKSDDSPTTLQRLQAKWNYQKEYYHENYGGVDYRDTSYASSGDYSDFRADGKVYSKYSTSYDTLSYSLLGDTKIITTSTYMGVPYNDTVDIIVLNDTQLQVYSKSFDPAPDYYEYTDFYTK